MRKEIKFATLGVCAFILGMGMNNLAMSEVGNFKIAVVDVQKVVSSSTQVKTLKSEQQTKVKSVQQFVANARKSVAAESDATKKKSLEDKFNKELRTQTSAIEKEYAKKLQAIDKSISGTIEAQAKAKNYNVVLAKGVVLYGGDDITEAVIKATK